jgi:hypothetical protein
MKKICFSFFYITFLLAPSFSAGAVLQMDYAYNKQDTWRAVLIALSNYPLEVTNFEQGLIKTKVLTEGEIWKPHFRSANPEYTYVMSINVFDSSDGTRVSIDKDLKRRAGFNRNEETLKTEKVEEDLLLYRVKRELLIDKLIKKYFN